MTTEQKIERCGFCGSLFRGDTLLSVEELNATPQNIIDEAPLGYCPNAQAENAEENPPQRYVTRDMAIDAGDLSLEGQTL